MKCPKCRGSGDMPAVGSYGSTWATCDKCQGSKEIHNPEERWRWQTIETAPKDGTHILLYAPEKKWEDAPAVGQHASTCPERITCGNWYDGRLDDDMEPGWLSWDGGFSDDHAPTHWMELPSKPEENS